MTLSLAFMPPDHLRGAAAGRDAAVGMRADHEDAARVRQERQQALVAQQDRAFLL
jgi:hypothetical protein